ncbi:pyridoxamine 5'-phosphate oxidase family protein [Cellulomonas taurus]|jgi:F420H(2)-dependent biliverdin reductase|uniref:pyridoxamine 5'-phosphate oxidase family protein n=1 Tax=Cellulomonas taurus TaxID=2729175 RepID=UPI00145C80F6|nr:TIGR03618 family F420-dependent PPOX class oxidoreductase [Cellulomonas taurus]
MPRLTDPQRAFVTERHLATLTTLRADGSPHVVPVAFTWDDEAGIARITTNPTTVKVRNARRGTADAPTRAALCQVDGRRWLTLEGTISADDSPAELAEALRRYGERYRPRDPLIERVVLRVAVERVMSSRDLR